MKKTSFALRVIFLSCVLIFGLAQNVQACVDGQVPIGSKTCLIAPTGIEPEKKSDSIFDGLIEWFKSFRF